MGGEGGRNKSFPLSPMCEYELGEADASDFA